MSVRHCTVPSSTAFVWPLGICLEWVVDMLTGKHSSTLALLILSNTQATSSYIRLNVEQMFSKQSREPLALLPVQGLQSTPVKQGTTYIVLFNGTTQTKEMYSELLKPNKLIYQSVAQSYCNITCSLSNRRFCIPSKSESVFPYLFYYSS